jgi:hypothetical protein
MKFLLAACIPQFLGLSIFKPFLSKSRRADLPLSEAGIWPKKVKNNKKS